MFKYLCMTVVATATFVQPALANDQLARTLGVDPAAYSTADLIRLKAAVEEDDAARVQAILRNGNNGRVSTRNVGHGGGHRQLAASLGVDPDAFSTAQLVQLRQAIDDQQRQSARYIASQGKVTVANLSTTDVRNSPGHRQMAASLGVDPEAHSKAAVIEMRHDKWSD